MTAGSVAKRTGRRSTLNLDDEKTGSHTGIHEEIHEWPTGGRDSRMTRCSGWHRRRAGLAPTAQ